MAPHQGLIDRLTDQLKASGQEDARNMALSILRDRGHVERNSERLTAEGLHREMLGPAGRAIDRAAKTSGRLSRDFEYDARTNRATLKKK